MNSAGIATAPPAALAGARLVIASDVHLRHLGDDRGTALLGLIERLTAAAAPVEAFVLNGDVFDFCFGGSAYFRRKFERLGAALAALAERGTRVVFVEGNHEFSMGEMGWRGVEIVAARDLVITLASGQRVRITHGDLLSGDPLYAAFRGLIKSRFASLCARLVPGSWLDAYALGHARVSRSQDKYRTLDHGRILGHFEAWLDEDAHAAHGVMGHFHVPYAERRRARDGVLLCVDSWETRPNALALGAAGEWVRVELALGG